MTEFRKIKKPFKAILTVQNPGDRLKVWLNGGLIFDNVKPTAEMPDSHKIDFTHKLKSGDNQLKVNGLNSSEDGEDSEKPWNFQYRIFWENKYLAEIDQSGPASETGWGYRKKHHLQK